MGATTYTDVRNGENAIDIFNELVEESQTEYGMDPYNGTISTTELGVQVYLSDEAMKASTKDLWKYIDEDDDSLFPSKRNTNYANLGVDHYKAFTVKWRSDEKTPKREKGVRTIQGFSVKRKYGNGDNTEYHTLTEAKQHAKEMVMDREVPYEIRKHRSDGSKFTLGYMELVTDGKEYKSARKAKTKIYKPINRFAFFVYAAE